MRMGKVFIVGAGPGDVGLITQRGAKLLKKADVVVMDALVNPALVRSSRAKIITAGKRGPGAPMGSSAEFSQDRINKLLVRLGREGHLVVRLKGGDPFLFGRGSEELDALRRAKIPYEVVPGVSSALAVPAYAGIPVTDRRWASQVTIITGQEGKEKSPEQSAVDWKKLSPRGTLVILMGVSRWPDLQKKLIRNGWQSNAPIAAIESGTTSRQRVIRTTLKESVNDFQRHRLVAPSIVVVGDVVRLQSSLSWLHERPLLGRRIMITRPWDQARDFIALLEDKGAEVYVSPSINIKPLNPQLKKSPTDYDWVVLLSANAVEHFARVLGERRGEMRRAKILAIGPRTAAAVRAQKWKVARMAGDFNSFGVKRVLGHVRAQSFLIPRVQDAPPTLSQLLKQDGGRVTEMAIYKTLPMAPTKAMHQIALSGVDAITFTSGSTARYFLKSFSSREKNLIFKNTLSISIGPMTTAALKAGGVPSVLESDISTTEGMVETLCRIWSQ